MRLRVIVACGCLALLMPLTAAAETGRSLQASLEFVRAKMVAQGGVDYVANLHDSTTGQSWANRFTADMSNVSIDAASCKLSFHWKTTLDGASKQDMDSEVPFSLLNKVSVINREQEIRTQVAGDHPSWTSTVTPAVWVVTMSTSDRAYVFDFTDQDVAERVSRAVDHIMDLCGAPKAGF